MKAIGIAALILAPILYFFPLMQATFVVILSLAALWIVFFWPLWLVLGAIWIVRRVCKRRVPV
jgi:hypothetical protein